MCKHSIGGDGGGEGGVGDVCLLGVLERIRFLSIRYHKKVISSLCTCLHLQ